MNKIARVKCVLHNKLPKDVCSIMYPICDIHDLAAVRAQDNTANIFCFVDINYVVHPAYKSSFNKCESYLKKLEGDLKTQKRPVLKKTVAADAQRNKVSRVSE